MNAGDGWQYQGRQDHGHFGTGTKPRDAAAGDVRAGLASPRLRGRGFRPSFAWDATHLAAASRDAPAAPASPFAPLPLPNPDMGPVARERAQRRWAYVSDAFARGDYGAVAGHLLFGQPFPVEVDEPEPEKLPTAAVETGAVGSGAPDPDHDPKKAVRGKLIGSLVEATESERRWVNERLNEGKEVEVIAASNTHRVRTPDFRVDGVAVELKTLEDVKTLSEERLSAKISRVIEGASGQSQDIAIDATKYPEVTKEVAERGIRRGHGKLRADGKDIPRVTVYTQIGPITWKAQ